MTGYTLVGVNGQDEGSNLGFGAYLNFTGAGVTASISGDVITVNIPGGGGGGTPALPFNSVQFNNAGAFGGSANFTWNGTGLVVTDGAGTTDTLSPGSLLFTTAGTGTISVKDGGGGDAPLNLDILDLQVNGSSGLAGQVLTSAGPGASPTWAAVPAASGWVDGGTTVYLSTSTDVVSIGSNTPVTNRKLSVYNTGTNLGVSVVTLASTDNVLETGVSGEANLRYSVNGSGSTLWGAGGGSALDTRILRSGASTLALDNGAAGAANFVPGADNTGNLGTTTTRWNAAISTNFYVYTTAGAANPTTALQGQALRFGAGGATALDLRLFRSGVSTLSIDANGGGGATIVPASDSAGVFGTNNLRWSDNIANTHRVFPSAGAVNASSSLGSGFLRLGVGGATALDTQISRTAAKTLTVDDTAAGSIVFRILGQTTTQTRALQTTTQSGAYAVAVTDDVVFVNSSGGAFDVTLPNANVITGRRVQVKRINTSANIVTVKSAGGTIDNVAAATGIVLAGGTLNAITVVSDGTNWWIV